MKTTLDIPDALFREAKIVAASEGTTLRAVFTRALRAELERSGLEEGMLPSWRKAFGALGHLRTESDIVSRSIEEAFETIDDESWR